MAGARTIRRYLSIVSIIAALLIVIRIYFLFEPSDNEAAHLKAGVVHLPAAYLQQLGQGRPDDGRLAGAGSVKLAGFGSLDDVMGQLSPHWTFRPTFLDASPEVGVKMKSDRPLIPHILHQVWNTQEVPRRFLPWLHSWSVTHPSWDYWFWTLDGVRDLIALHYPSHAVLYDSYTAPVFRADAARYFILHTYGGVYVDLDTDALRPLDNWTSTYSCLLSEESYEHAFVIREESHTNIVNGFIACRAKHPLLRLAIDSLQDAARQHFGDYLRATGPTFFDKVYRRHESSLLDMFFGSSKKSDVVVVPPTYFLPTFDESQGDVIAGKCSLKRARQLPEKGRLLCRALAARSFKNEPGPGAYINHHWMHAYLYDEAWLGADVANVKTVVPRIVFGANIVSASRG